MDRLISCGILMLVVALAQSGFARPNNDGDQGSNVQTLRNLKLLTKAVRSAKSTPKVNLTEELSGVSVMDPRAPEITNPVSTSVTAQSGGMLQLACDAKASPDLAIYWYFNGKPLVTGDPGWLEGIGKLEYSLNRGLVTLQASFTKSVLSIPCVGYKSEGLYSCVAESRLGTATKNFTLSINENSSDDMECVSKGKPTSVTWTTGRFENEGVAMQLQCRVAAGSRQIDPAPKWFKAVADEEDGIERWSPVAGLDGYGTDFEVLQSSNDLLVKGHACPSVCLFACQDGTRRYKSFIYSTVYP